VTHEEGIALALNLAGGVGVSASVVMALAALDGGDAQDLIDGLRLLGIGAVSLLASRSHEAQGSRPEKPLPRDRH
jgi:hypothetical protein